MAHLPNSPGEKEDGDGFALTLVDEDAVETDDDDDNMSVGWRCTGKDICR
jgi:hypothetical protein